MFTYKCKLSFLLRLNDLDHPGSHVDVYHALASQQMG